RDNSLSLAVAPWIWWLPDGEKLLVVGNPDQNDMTSFTVFTYDLFAQELQHITQNVFRVHLWMSDPIQLSPDQTKLAFVWEDSHELYIMYLCY
ncbi:MAG: hypothetical protein U9R58_10025, partial [Chloroflexota bacterium]|nr:hypothetical protein [Chloroflexota bacterium]